MKIVLVVGGVLIAGVVLLVVGLIVVAAFQAMFPKPTPFQRAEAARLREAKRSPHYRGPSRDVGIVPVLVVLGAFVAVWFFALVIYAQH